METKEEIKLKLLNFIEYHYPVGEVLDGIGRVRKWHLSSNQLVLTVEEYEHSYSTIRFYIDYSNLTHKSIVHENAPIFSTDYDIFHLAEELNLLIIDSWQNFF